MVITSPDVQSYTVANGFKLTRVGLTQVRKPVSILRGERTIHFMPTMDVFIDRLKQDVSIWKKAVFAGSETG